MRTVSRIVPAAVVLSGLMLTTACANDTESAAPGPSATPPATATLGSSPSASPSSSSPSPSPSASSSSSGTKGGVFSGTRQVHLLPKNSEATLGVVPDGKIGLSEKFGDKDLFVIKPLTPGGDQYWIQTAKLRDGAEPFCLSAKLGAGQKPAPVKTASCDASAADQKFRFRQTGESNGKPTYTIYTGTTTYIIQDPTGEIAHTGTGVAAVSIGEGTPDIDTPFVIADKGQASMPALD
ncbi:hypothetical protein JIG36_23080 [Actinoplanes sp. LDG1-06]|uniref:Ricin B lectin domain-containing protein n=1 Tax=Paractinoplanes ovalisporus TaxID=2810368 RepID=A0ABS2AF36_9ACTN|nr:hypothetical protein [Actinoplanes ovalisporus]MBM2618446.1 hypothetical protein [Actinoplanes ovalisporus]